MTVNQGRRWRYSYIVVKSITEFAISHPPPGAAGPYSTSLVLRFLSARGMGYLRQVSLLVGCHGLNACVLPKFICWKLNSQSDDYRRWDHWKMVRSWGQSPHEWDQDQNPHEWDQGSCERVLKDLLIPSIQRYILKEALTHSTMLAPWSWILASRTVTNNTVYKPPSLWNFGKATCVH